MLWTSACEYARESREQARDDPGQDDHAAGVDPGDGRERAIVGDGAHRPSERGATEQDADEHDRDDGHGDGDAWLPERRTEPITYTLYGFTS